MGMNEYRRPLVPSETNTLGIRVIAGDGVSDGPYDEPFLVQLARALMLRNPESEKALTRRMLGMPDLPEGA